MKKFNYSDIAEDVKTALTDAMKRVQDAIEKKELPLLQEYSLLEGVFFPALIPSSDEADSPIYCPMVILVNTKTGEVKFHSLYALVPKLGEDSSDSSKEETTGEKNSSPKTDAA